MRTVGWLKKELEKFHDDELCFAYEGEATGLAVGDIGFIHCSSGDDDGKDTENPRYDIDGRM